MARRILQLLLPPLLTVAFLFGCGKREEVSALEGKTMGTYWHIKIASSLSESQAQALRQAVEKRLDEVNQSMSTYIPDSEISRFNQWQSSEPFRISADFAKVVGRAQAISSQSEGFYDITVMPLVNLWGFGYEKTDHKPSEEQLQTALATVGYGKIHLEGQRLRKDNPQTAIDLSSIAKGFGVDALAETIEAAGHKNYLVDIGGEVRAGGTKFGAPWKLGIETPVVGSAGSSSLVLEMSGKTALATSGNYRNYIDYDGQRAVHSIDPHTGRPRQSRLLSVTVVAEDCMSADGYATALMVSGDERAETLAAGQNLAVLFIYADGDKDFRIWRSPEFVKKFGS